MSVVVLSVDAVRPPLTGVGRYTKELAEHLPAHEEIKLRLHTRHGFVDALPNMGGGEASHWLARGRSLVTKRLLKTPFLVDMADAYFTRQGGRHLAGLPDAVFHGPNFYLPYDTRGPKVVTIHDLSIYKLPHFHPPERVRYMHTHVQRSIEIADAVIVVSEAMKQEVIDHFNVAQDRVFVTHLAPAAEFVPLTADQTRAELSVLGLDHGGYCLFAGTIEPRKNIHALLDAYELLVAESRLELPLIVCGHPGWASETVHERLRECAQAGWLRYLSYVDENTLQCLVAGAALVSMPSLYEGFGLPIVEAMACGVPVVCSAIDVFAEVSGGACSLVQVDDSQAFAAAMLNLLEDQASRQQHIAKGLARAEQFSWAATAAQTARVYKLVENR